MARVIGSPPSLNVRFETSLAAVAAADWDACASGAGEDRAHPFTRHAFLLSLEAAGCVGGRTGWIPTHVLVEAAGGEMVGAAPCYLKLHSQGEYVFDHAWADAYERAGGSYYPKLQVAVPFTPVTGPRLLVRDGADRDGVCAALLHGLSALRQNLGASSVHVSFPIEDDWVRLGTAGYLQRIDQQFHWTNAGYGSFDDFLFGLASRKRKNIKKERAAALRNAIEIDWLRGDAITEGHWDAFFAFYMDTGSRKWGRPYLNRRFFTELHRRMSDQLLLVMARRHGRFIAGAINFIGDGVLYGRNWGCIEDHPFLHFEVCYYQAIDFAIAHGLKRVEAGAQGEHKLARGYMPATTFSAHMLADGALRRAVADYLDRERRHVEQMAQALAAEGPYRQRSEEN